jgi:hypothetical protein
MWQTTSQRVSIVNWATFNDPFRTYRPKYLQNSAIDAFWRQNAYLEVSLLAGRSSSKLRRFIEDWPTTRVLFGFEPPPSTELSRRRCCCCWLFFMVTNNPSSVQGWIPTVSARNWTQGHQFHMSKDTNPTSRSTNFILQFEALQWEQTDLTRWSKLSKLL